MRPAIDYTLEPIDRRLAATSVMPSVAGIAKDVAYGSTRLPDLGCGVVAQNEATSAVNGMPDALAELGATDSVVSLDRVADEIGLLLRSRGGRSMISGDRSARGAKKTQASAA